MASTTRPPPTSSSASPPPPRPANQAVVPEKLLGALRSFLGLDYEISGSLNVGEDPITKRKELMVHSAIIIPGTEMEATSHNLNEEVGFHTHPLSPIGLFPPSGQDYVSLLQHATRFLSADDQAVAVNKLKLPNQQASVVIAGNGTWVLYPTDQVFSLLNMFDGQVDIRSQWVSRYIREAINDSIGVKHIFILQPRDSTRTSHSRVWIISELIGLMAIAETPTQLAEMVGLIEPLIRRTGARDCPQFTEPARRLRLPGSDKRVQDTNAFLASSGLLSPLKPCKNFSVEEWEKVLRNFAGDVTNLQLTLWSGSTTPVVVKRSPSSEFKGPQAQVIIHVQPRGSPEPSPDQTKATFDGVTVGPIGVDPSQGMVTMVVDKTLLDPSVGKKQLEPLLASAINDHWFVADPERKESWDQMVSELMNGVSQVLHKLINQSVVIRSFHTVLGSTLVGNEKITLKIASTLDPELVYGITDEMQDPNNPYNAFQRAAARQLGFALELWPATVEPHITVLSLPRTRSQTIIEDPQQKTGISSFFPILGRVRGAGQTYKTGTGFWSKPKVAN